VLDDIVTIYRGKRDGRDVRELDLCRKFAILADDLLKPSNGVAKKDKKGSRRGATSALV